jgi:hypothetical protein
MPSGKYDADIRAALLGYSKPPRGGTWNDDPQGQDEVGALIQNEDENAYKDYLLDRWYDELRDRSLPPSVLPPPMTPEEIADLKRRYMRR